MIRIIRILFVAFLFTSIFSSCIVGKKKYEDLQSQKLKVDDQNTELTNKLTIMNTKFDSLLNKYKELEKKQKELTETSATEQEKLNTELKAKIKLLEESNKKIAELQALIDKQKKASKDLLDKIKTALLGFTKDELTVEMKDGKVYVSLSEKLLFKSGSAVVDKKGKEALAKVGEVLAKQKDVDIVIEGHTDNVPLNGEVIKDNWDLSVLRATAIVRILTEDYKVDSKQIIPSGRADNVPVADNSTKEGKAKNRRTEIILSPKISDLIKLLDINN
ncbi:MAG TPA: OmpA family protein [Bacteroidales bacterium]|nr:OmpA family protein [Bacteroidales bacterium]HPS17929.1 OmpA family protein [Bacteroidales bacterium]